MPSFKVDGGRQSAYDKDHNDNKRLAEGAASIAKTTQNGLKDLTDKVAKLSKTTATPAQTEKVTYPIPLSKGGTGATTAPVARQNLGLGTASTYNVAETGDAAASQVVKGDDSRLVPALRYAEDIGDGVATSFVVTHNLNTQDVIVAVRAVGSPFGYVTPNTIEATSVNTVTVTFLVAPTTDQYRVIVLA